jgi:nucleoside-diphosphate-sugar epimerase
MRLLVLGGSSFVGRALVEAGLARGWDVTTFNRGRGAWAHPDARRIVGDRTDPATLAPLAQQDWDVVADTWSGAASAARDSAAVLAPRARHYAYISSCSVYAPPPPQGLDETAPTVDAAPGDGWTDDYARRKRGSELAVQEAFGDRALLVRCGLILGPHEDVGRLPWWLNRMAAGGEVLAPGPPERPVQLVDVRDAGGWIVRAAEQRLSGPFNVTGEPVALRDLLDACIRATGSDATVTWVDESFLLERDVGQWMEVPLWVAAEPGSERFHETDTTKARTAGFRERSLEEIVLGALEQAETVDGVGLTREREAELLRLWHERA